MKAILKNSVFQYIFTRYGVYGLQFLNSILIAFALGSYYLGIWGFILLIIQYFQKIDFGIPNALNVLGSKNKNEPYLEKIFHNTILLTCGLALVVFLIFTSFKLFNVTIGEKYDIDRYFFLIASIAIMGYFPPLFLKIARIKGDIRKIAISQSLLPVFYFISVLFLDKEPLLWGLLIGNFLSLIVSIWLFKNLLPLKLRLQLDFSLSRLIIKKGLTLFVYLTSFYFIIISTRTIIMFFYSVDEFGYFTFSYSLGNVVTLLLSSFSFLIFPKIINRFGSGDDKGVIGMLDKIRKSYIVSSHLLVHIIIIIFSSFLRLFPEYLPSMESFRLVALALVLQSNTFGYQSLLIARDREKLMAILTLIALFLNIVLGISFSSVLGFSFSKIILATTICYFAYIFMLGYYGRKEIGLPFQTMPFVKEILPFQIFFPYIITLGLSLIGANTIYFFIPLFLFITLNLSAFREIKNTVVAITKNPKIINI